MSNSELRNLAYESLNGKWIIAVLAFVIYSIVSGVGAPAILFIGGALTLGISTFSLKISRGEKAEIEDVFSGFNNFINSLVAYLLMNIFILLWLLLLIIPGIIKAISYSQTFFIMADNSEIKGMDAIDKSMEMMHGYKMKYFLMSLFFFMLFILSGLLLFIPLFWIIPYAYVSYAKFYDDLKSNKITE